MLQKSLRTATQGHYISVLAVVLICGGALDGGKKEARSSPVVG
jgi:hypothetical protein